MLFSEPKIPQSVLLYTLSRTREVFQCSSASRKFLNRTASPVPVDCTRCFSALQRAENSSMMSRSSPPIRRGMFQCSSASRKFLNLNRRSTTLLVPGFQCSSASRKFLNHTSAQYDREQRQFQCSSASRKFLNRLTSVSSSACGACFSALQRAENSSMALVACAPYGHLTVSVLFSEPKIPQFVGWFDQVSAATHKFQCSSASRKFLNVPGRHVLARGAVRFSALQRAENSSIATDRNKVVVISQIVSVLFSEPKIPQ